MGVGALAVSAALTLDAVLVLVVPYTVARITVLSTTLLFVDFLVLNCLHTFAAMGLVPQRNLRRRALCTPFPFLLGLVNAFFDT